MKTEKKQLSQSKLHKYAKSRLGYSGGFEVSPYQTAAKALELDDFQMPSGCTYKKWVIKHADFILSEVAKLKGSFPAKATPAKPIRQPTELSVKMFVKSSGINPASDDFLHSFEWKSVRMMALKKHGAVCQCCGASPMTGAVMNVDHIKPRKIFPQLALDVENLQILCSDCNHGKGNWDMTDWRKEATSIAAYHRPTATHSNHPSPAVSEALQAVNLCSE